MKHFIILQWTDDKFNDFVDTSADENYSDALSKPTGRTKFYEHTDVFMGRRKPAYTSYIDHSNTKAHIINRIQVMSVILRSIFGVLFHGGVSPSKNGLIAPSLERAQLRYLKEVPVALYGPHLRC
jgi:hypothetical protein